MFFSAQMVVPALGFIFISAFFSGFFPPSYWQKQQAKNRLQEPLVTMLLLLEATGEHMQLP